MDFARPGLRGLKNNTSYVQYFIGRTEGTCSTIGHQILT